MEEFICINEEISNLKVLNKHHYRGFPISDKQNEEIKRWKEKHEREYHKTNSYSDAVGGNYTYLFTPSSIGTIGCIKCECGVEFVFQDI